MSAIEEGGSHLDSPCYGSPRYKVVHNNERGNLTM